jgi:hypothetical protein
MIMHVFSKSFWQGLGFLLGVVFLLGGCPKNAPDDHPCKEENHCVREDGQTLCEDGYQWEDPDDGDNYNCVPANGGGENGGNGGTNGGGNACSGGLTLCGDSCVDTSNDLQHCKGCNAACSAGDICGVTGCEAGPDCRETPCTGLSYCDLGSGNCLYGCANTDQCGANENCNLSNHECECNTGFHKCGGVCVSNNDVDTCGSACSPCPGMANGSATCNGSTCGYSCNSGYRDCGGACAQCPADASSSTCNGNQCVASACSSGLLACDGACLQCPSNASVEEWGCVDGGCAATVCATNHAPCASGCCAWSRNVVHTFTDSSYQAHWDMDVDDSDVAHVVVSEDSGTVWLGSSADNFGAMTTMSLTGINLDPDYYTMRPTEETWVAIRTGWTGSYLLRSYDYTHHYTMPTTGSQRYRSLAIYEGSGTSFSLLDTTSGYDIRDISVARAGSGLTFSMVQNWGNDWRIWVNEFTGTTEDNWSYFDEGLNIEHTASADLGSAHHVAYALTDGTIKYSTSDFSQSVIHSAVGGLDGLSMVYTGGTAHLVYSAYDNGAYRGFVLSGSETTWNEVQLPGEVEYAFAILTDANDVQVVATDGVTGNLVLFTRSGGSWTSREILSVDPNTFFRLERVVLSDDGTLHLLALEDSDLVHLSMDHGALMGEGGGGNGGAPDAGPGGTPDSGPGGMLCTETCQYSNDGECDDGGEGSSFSLCDLGTDCLDCGPR